ncbi:MAG: hypothetical protein MK108_13495, partial [Mariniblastus sp.]|nr:hypothetical protein [Mariniblastus sp.]
MNREQFQTLADGFGQLRIALVGDFCLDRYLEIDGTLQETSLETGREVHNVTQVRVSSGGCGTILNNLVALGVGEIIPVGWIGRDAAGWELRRVLKAERGVNLDYLIKTRRRKTFTYIKPIKMEDGRSPQELNRLDIKNWTPTPDDLSKKLARSLEQIGKDVDAIILLDQADLPGTGVITTGVLDA